MPVHNERVTSVQKHCRDMSSSGGKNVPLGNHCGVKANTASGNSYLVHKGPGYDKKYGGSGGATVATPARHMSSNWRPEGSSRGVSNGTRVGDLIKAGGTNYNAWHYNSERGNCLQASNRMMDRATKN